MTLNVDDFMNELLIIKIKMLEKEIKSLKKQLAEANKEIAVLKEPFEHKSEGRCQL
jgi:peptidoglycan hydrolase CwlO-like protein